MFEIKGKISTAVCYANTIEEEAIEQIRRMCDYEFTEGSKICIMPDVHAGKGCTIGTTMTVHGKAVPNIVGVDIGCGMYTVNIGKVDIDFEKVDEAAHYIPSGMNVWQGRQERFNLQELACYRSLSNTKYLERSLGKQVAEIYQHLAVELHSGKEEYFKKRDEIIATYKAEGRRKEIHAALKELRWERRDSLIPDDLCYLYGTYFDDYLHDVEICQQFARKNREKIAEVLLNYIGMEAGEAFHTIHNYIDTENMILRKGAISAYKDEKILIPINMRDGSVLATGKGNPDWNYSAPHGAGRLMSRTKAKEALSMEEYKNVMEGIYTTSVNEATLDEAPMAYKSLDDIIDAIKESVNIIDIMKPVYNFKAS